MERNKKNIEAKLILKGINLAKEFLKYWLSKSNERSIKGIFVIFGKWNLILDGWLCKIWKSVF
jgi:hypothetical protein